MLRMSGEGVGTPPSARGGPEGLAPLDTSCLIGGTPICPTKGPASRLVGMHLYVGSGRGAAVISGLVLRRRRGFADELDPILAHVSVADLLEDLQPVGLELGGLVVSVQVGVGEVAAQQCLS